MKLYSWNVNGLRSVCKKGFVDFVSSAKPDLLALQEIKVLPEQLGKGEAAPEGYHYVFNSALRKGYSGVACLIRDGLDYKVQRKGLGENRFDEEGRYLCLQLGDYTLYNIYFPSGSSGDARQRFKYEFLDHLLEHLAALSAQERSRVIICGDFNICHKAVDIHHPKIAAARELSGFLPEERAWMDALMELGFEDTFRRHHPEAVDAYSWWSFRAGSRGKNLGWRLDYFVVGSDVRTDSAQIHSEQLGSDHCPVSIELSCQ